MDAVERPPTPPEKDVEDSPEPRAQEKQIFQRIRAPANALFEDADDSYDVVYRVTEEVDITDEQLKACAELYSSQFGTWDDNAWRFHGLAARPGHRIRTSPEEIKAQCLLKNANNILMTAVTRSNQQIGHCFVSQCCHGEDRLWWIPQIIVYSSYRGRNRATRMLQTFAMHYDIGNKPDQRDFVGVASVNPYVVCTVLRVFARGIENLPSELDWDRCDAQHRPLPRSMIAEIIKSAPLDRIRQSQVCKKTMTLKTDFYTDHTFAEVALERVVFSMNKQLDDPWLWPFGELAPGHEYVCILDYQYDPEYDMRPQFRLQRRVHVTEEKPKVSKLGGFARPTQASRGRANPFHLSRKVNFVEMDRFLKDFPKQLSGSAVLQYRTRMNLFQRTLEKRIVKARSLLDAYGCSLVLAMNARTSPKCLQDIYMRGDEQILEYRASWKEVKVHASLYAKQDKDIELRLLLLQAVHFQEMLDEKASLSAGIVAPSHASKTIGTMIRGKHEGNESVLPRLMRALSPISALSRLSRASRSHSKSGLSQADSVIQS